MTSSWGFTRCGYHQQQQGVPPTSHDNNNDNNDHDALITGLFFLGGSKSDNGSEFQYGNIRVHLQTSSQGFVIGAGRGSISILRITLRFTLDFMDGEDFGLDLENESKTKMKTEGATDQEGQGRKVEGSRTGEQDGQHSLSLSLTVTITIMAVNSTSLS